MNKIIITPADIIDAEWWQGPLHIAEKKGLPVKYKNVFDVKNIDIDWDKVEYAQYWVCLLYTSDAADDLTTV